jgi:acyl-CoA reductase-like NAD-dependent aldehyde dehydrogenase
MSLQTSSIIRNVDVDGPRSITSYNPATEQEIASVSALESEGAVDAVCAAKEAFPGWAATPIAERQKLIGRWLEIMLEEGDELARLVSDEGGKPITEAKLVDVFPGLETLHFYSKKLSKVLAFKPVKPFQLLFAHWKAGYRFDPLGVMAVITPWNYPVGIPLAEIVPAVGAGNTVVFKPASATVLTGLMLGDMARRAGFPPGVINTVAHRRRARPSGRGQGSLHRLGRHRPPRCSPLCRASRSGPAGTRWQGCGCCCSRRRHRTHGSGCCLGSLRE